MNTGNDVAISCPVCGSSALHEFCGNDLMFGTPGSYDYSRCTLCGIVFQTPMPNSEQIASYYPEQYEQYQPERSKRLKNFEKGALKAVFGYQHFDVPNAFIYVGRLLGPIKYSDTPPFRVGRRALDIGCANGKFLSKLNAMGWDAQGVEFDKVAVDVCRNSGLSVFHGDLHTAGFPDQSFDMVSARHVIEHVPDPEKFMAEIARILRPSGYFYAKTPNSKALGRKVFGRYWYPNDVPRHLVLFSIANLTAMAQRHGMKRTKAKIQTSPKAVLNSLDYVIGKKGKASKRRQLLRILARILYVWPVATTNQGDEIFAIFEKQ